MEERDLAAPAVCSMLTELQVPEGLPQENASFYQKNYRQENVTDLPPEKKDTPLSYFGPF